MSLPFPGFVHKLDQAFRDRGHELYAVGGCVRDQLLGRPVSEYDLTTNARPEETRQLVSETAPEAVYTIGEKFGTIGAIYAGTRVEITTYRGESYDPDSRKPHVEFSATLQQDLQRRDFTINAIAAEIGDGGLIDPLGGRADLDLRLLRAVGVPDDRFGEDPLRLLRAVRFAAALEFEIERTTASSIERCARELQKISQERIRDELHRMLLGPHPERALELCADLGLLEYALPELLELRTVAPGGGRHKDMFAHTLQVVTRAPREPVQRWAALLHDIAKPRTVGWKDGEIHFNGHEKVGEVMSREILGRLRCEGQLIDAVARVVGMHTHANSYNAEWTDGAVRRLVRDAGEGLEPLLDLSAADVTSARREKVEAAARRVEELRGRIQALEAEASILSLRPPIDGNDLMRLFDRPPGPWIRPIKDYLLDLVIDGQLAPDDRETAERLAREKYAELEESA